MDINAVVKGLRSGVKTIISRHSPPCNRELSKNYLRSVHSGREILFVISGSSNYLCNNSVYPCSSGTVMLFDSGISHGYCYQPQEHDLIHLWGYVQKRKFFWNIVEVVDNGQIRFSPHLRHIALPDVFSEVLEYRWNHLGRQKNITEETVTQYMKEPMELILGELALRVSEMHSMLPPETLMDKAKEYIYSLNGRKCTAESLAQIFGYTRSHFAHKFRDETGMSIGEFADQVRLEYVRTAMKRKISQKEMAYELGYSSGASFWRWLQKHKAEL